MAITVNQSAAIVCFSLPPYYDIENMHCLYINSGEKLLRFIVCSIHRHVYLLFVVVAVVVVVGGGGGGVCVCVLLVFFLVLPSCCLVCPKTVYKANSSIMAQQSNCS